MAEIVITEADRGSTRSVKIGDTLLAQLSETPTTGFRWVPVIMDPKILELLQDQFQSALQSGIGGGGLRTFRILAKGVGRASFHLELRRSWESNPPKAVFQVEVDVHS